MTSVIQHGGRASGENIALTRWQRCLGHAGYLAEGILYLPVGFFALLAAVRHPQPNGAAGALARVAGTLLGDALLAALAVGLAAFVLWQLIVAIADPQHRAERRSGRRRLVRIGHLLSGVFHCVFVTEAVFSILGLNRANEDGQSQIRWAARAFALPVGRYLAALTGLGIVCFGVWQFYRALTPDKNKRVKLDKARFGFLISALGVYGLMARGMLFCLVGGYLTYAAWRHQPRYSGGIAGALGGLKQQPYGAGLLGAVAVGLLCYGLYQIAKEPYRQLEKS